MSLVVKNIRNSALDIGMSSFKKMYICNIGTGVVTFDLYYNVHEYNSEEGRIAEYILGHYTKTLSLAVGTRLELEGFPGLPVYDNSNYADSRQLYPTLIASTNSSSTTEGVDLIIETI